MHLNKFFLPYPRPISIRILSPVTEEILTIQDIASDVPNKWNRLNQGRVQKSEDFPHPSLGSQCSLQCSYTARVSWSPNSIPSISGPWGLGRNMSEGCVSLLFSQAFRVRYILQREQIIKANISETLITCQVLSALHILIHLFFTITQRSYFQFTFEKLRHRIICPRWQN